MGLFDDIVGGVLGGALGGQGGSDAGSLFEIVNQMGGLDAVMDRLREGGLDDQIGTWISQGANQHVTPERIRAILGDGVIARAAQSPMHCAGPMARRWSAASPCSTPPMKGWMTTCGGCR